MTGPILLSPLGRLSVLAPLLLSLAAAPGAARAAVPTQQEANALFERGDWKRAEEAYAAIAKADPKNGLAWYRLGVCRGSQKDYKGARGDRSGSRRQRTADSAGPTRFAPTPI